MPAQIVTFTLKKVLKSTVKMTSHRYGEITGLNSSLSERQDSMFDGYLEEMKPFVLRLPHKSGNLTQVHDIQFSC